MYFRMKNYLKFFFQFPQNYEKTINYKIYDRSQRKKLNLPYGDEKTRNFVRKIW